MWLITFLVPKGPYFLFLTIQYYWLSILYMNKCWKVIYKAELWNSFVCQNLVGCCFFGCWQKSWYETYAIQLGLKWKKWLATSLKYISISNPFWLMPTRRAQHRFVQLWNESKNEGGLQEDRIFDGKMQDKITLAWTRFAHFGRQDAGYP